MTDAERAKLMELVDSWRATLEVYSQCVTENNYHYLRGRMHEIMNNYRALERTIIECDGRE